MNAVAEKGRVTVDKDREQRARKAFDASFNGWFMSGAYRAQFFEHERRFEAETLRELADKVTRWFESHADRHGNDILLVKYAGPAEQY